MAKIFRKLYHDLSSSWDFRQATKSSDFSSVVYDILMDQDGIYVISVNSRAQTTPIVFRYNLQEDHVVSSDADLSNNHSKSLYFKYIDFIYQNLTTTILERVNITVYNRQICKDNEYIQTQYQNIRFQVEGFFQDEKSIKIHFINFDMEDFTKFTTILASLSDKVAYRGWEQLTKSSFMTFFSADELFFFVALYKEKKSIGLKSQYMSISKEAFVKLIPYIKNLSGKFSIYETGERLLFADTPLSLNLFVAQVDDDHYTLRLSENHKIHQYFVYFSVYVLIQNTIHKVNLPFDDDAIVRIFENRFVLKASDLIYYKTIVGKQLSLFNNYLDFEEDITFPQVLADVPEVHFTIKAKKAKPPLLLDCNFIYEDGSKVPVSVISLDQNLFKLDFINREKWFYLPNELIENVRKFISEVLFFKFHSIERSDWEIAKEHEVEYVISNLYSKANPNWHFFIADDLKPKFVQTIDLVPEITLNTGESIDWFSYKITYKYLDLELTQDDLRKFFQSQKSYFTTPDGRNINIANREIFDQIENMLAHGGKDADHFHKLAIYRLPWIFELTKVNPLITIHGDVYLQQMYSDLKKRALPNTQVPHYSLNLIMRSYQKAGYEWLKLLEKYRLNGILADDMGLGKTLQAISVLTDLSPDSKSLIICPKTLLFNWGAEIDKFNPNLKYMIYEGSKDFRTTVLKTVPVQIILCSYSLIQNDLDEFSKINFDYVILDEAQHIKNHRTLRAKAIKVLRARHKLAMTGTPLENSITELWSIFDFLMPGYLPYLKKFMEMSNDAHSIQHYISPFILRRKKQEVLIELPDKQEQTVYCHMTEEQEKFYISVLNSMKNDKVSALKDITITEETISQPAPNFITILAALTLLRQICDHPGLIDENLLRESEMSGKLETLKELLTDALQSGRKILIFSQYINMLKVIERTIKKYNVQYEYMDGSTKDRKKCINHFNENEKVRIFLISLKTGGFGINLTAADTVILVDPWWNPMISNQAIDRVYRMGQTKKVFVYKLITKGSVEEKIMVLQKKKRDLFENVIEQGDAVLKKLEIDEIRQLFEYKA